MSGKILKPFAAFRVTLFFAPETGEFSGWLRMSTGDGRFDEQVHRIDPSADYDVVYEELCEEWGAFLLEVTEATRTELPLL